MALRRLLAFVSIALVVDTSAYAAITPLLPGLTDEHSLSKATAGMLSGAYPAGTLLFSLPAAWLVTRTDARITLIAGFAGLAAASLFFGLAGTAGGLIGARFVQGAAAAAMWAGALAWLVSVAPRERRAEVIGSAVGAAIAGALLGPVLGAAADEFGIGVVFGAYVAVPLLMIGWALRLTGAASVPGMRPEALRAALREPRMRTGVLLMALPAIGFGVVNVLVPLRFDELGAGAAAIALAFLAAVLLEAVMAPVVGRVADRRGRILPARIGLASGAVCLALLPLPRTVLLLGIVLVFTAPLLGMLWAPAMALLSDGAEGLGLDPALGFGLANMAWGAGATFGASGGGGLADATADWIPFMLLAGVTMGAALTLRRLSHPA